MRAAHEEGLLRDVAARKAQLRQLRLLVENEERLLGALAADLGKPAIEAYAADIGFTVREISEILDHLDRWVKPRAVRVPMVARPARLGSCRSRSAWHWSSPPGTTRSSSCWRPPRRWPPGTRWCSSRPRSAHGHRGGRTGAAVPRRAGRSRCDRRRAGDHRTAGRALRPHLLHRQRTGRPRGHGRAPQHLTPVTLELGGKSPQSSPPTPTSR